jgi:hypothetical protein
MSVEVRLKDMEDFCIKEKTKYFMIPYLLLTCLEETETVHPRVTFSPSFDRQVQFPPSLAPSEPWRSRWKKKDEASCVHSNWSISFLKILANLLFPDQHHSSRLISILYSNWNTIPPTQEPKSNFVFLNHDDRRARWEVVDHVEICVKILVLRRPYKFYPGIKKKTKKTLFPEFSQFYRFKFRFVSL